MSKRFIHYKDNQVGYLRVCRQFLKDMNLDQNDFSLCSKIDVNYMYLDEHTDMKWFIKEYTSKFNTEPEIKVKESQRCSLRNKHNNFFVVEEV